MTRKPGFWERFAYQATVWTGTSWAFLIALTTTLIWAATGPFFHFSDTWQLVMNTTSSIVTFLMVFLIQRSQNKDALTIQLKLNELIAAIQGASNRMINVEDLSEDEVRRLHHRYQKLARLAKAADSPTESLTIEEIRDQHLARPDPNGASADANPTAPPADREPQSL